jgi:hypothetical protein
VHRFAELVAPSRLGRSFRWLLASSWVTNLGDGITLAAGPLLVASETRNPLTVAMAALLRRLPWLLFGLYAAWSPTGLTGAQSSLPPAWCGRRSCWFWHTFNVTFGAAWSVLVLYARERLGMSALGFGLITTAMAVGGLLGTASYGWLERHIRLGVIMRGGLIIETLTHLALALTRWAWLALIIFVIFGAHAFIWGTTSASVRQRAVPTQFQGRVGSVYLTGVVGGIVIGSALGGLVASAWGVTAPFWFAFAGSALILAVIWRSLLHIAHADEHARTSGLTTARPEPIGPPRAGS